MKFAIEMPRTPAGSEARQLLELYSYLHRMAEQLNVAMNSIDEQNMAENTARSVKSAATKGEMIVGIRQQAETLKALIIKTADAVYEEMDRITASLESKYVATSEYGEYTQEISQEITALASGLEARYTKSETLAAIQDGTAAFSAFQAEMQNYILAGYLPSGEFGIAVGQDLAKTTVDGKEYVEGSYMACFTPQKLSFYINDYEAAYISGDTLYINHAEILEDVILGDWEIKKDPSVGFTIKNIG